MKLTYTVSVKEIFEFDPEDAYDGDSIPEYQVDDIMKETDKYINYT